MNTHYFSKCLVIVYFLTLCYSLQTLQSQPTNSADEMAARLAKNVLAGGDNVQSDLRSAILTSGIDIRENDNTITQSVKPGQGLVFNHWEVEAMVKMSAEGLTLQFTDLVAMLSKAIPDLDSAAAGKLLLNGIQTQAASNNPAFHFWAHLIIELGRQSADSIDLLENVDLTKVSLNAIQTTLILQRLSSDLLILFEGSNVRPGANGSGSNGLRKSPHETIKGSLQAFGMSHNNSLLHFCSWKQEIPTYQSLAIASNKLHLPGCAGIEKLPLGSDLLALGFTSGFGELLNYLSDKLDYVKEGVAKVEKVQKWLTASNILIALGRVYFTYASIEVGISMDNEPLIRNKNRAPGQSRQLTADVHMNTENLQFLNCVRLALNNMGIDVKITRNGPVNGAGIDWVLVKGGTSVNTKGDYSITDAIVEFANADFYLKSKTNDLGKAEVTIRGAARKTILPDNAYPAKKEFKVRVDVQLEPPEIGSTGVDAMGVVLSGPGGLVNIPLELLYKTHWYSSKTYTFGVKDWTTKGYKAWDPEMSGFTVSGVVCDPGKPFTIQQSGNGFIATFKFTPSSTETGSFSMDVKGIPEAHTPGTYIINADKQDMLEIHLKGITCIPTDSGKYCVDFVYLILLEPINTNECD